MPRSNLSANSYCLRDIWCDIATRKSLHFSRSNTTPVRLSTEGLVFIKKWEPIGELSPLFQVIDAYLLGMGKIQGTLCISGLINLRKCKSAIRR
jgi:hypothetical protein